MLGSPTSSLLTKDQIDKVGNAMIFFAERIQPLSKTKLLKLVYLTEEVFVKKYAQSFFGLRFDVWKLGPVSRELFVELSSEEPSFLSGYIQKKVSEDSVFILPARSFSDDEFSDNEIDTLEFIVKSFNASTAKDLIELTHRKHSPWYLTAVKCNVLDYLENGLLNSTDCEIDFSETLLDSPQKKELYLEHKRFLEQSKELKLN